MSHDIHQKRRDAYNEAYDGAYTLPDLIGPEDVGESADSWDDLTDEEIEEEIHFGLSETRSEHRGEIRDLAVSLWRADLPRAPMEDLVFETKEEAVKNGYHPNSMTYMECENILFECDIPADVLQEAWETISAGIADKMDPRREKGDSL